MSEKTNYKIADQEIKYLTQKEVKNLFSRIQDKRDKALFVTIYRYGLRASEATLLTPESMIIESISDESKMVS